MDFEPSNMVPNSVLIDRQQYIFQFEMAAGRHLGFFAYLENVIFFIQELYHAAYQCGVIYAHLAKG